MPLTRNFIETIRERAQTDPAFRAGLLTEAADSFLEGDVETGKALLRDYIHATLGFEALAKALGKSSKSLMRMLGPGGNPQATNLFAMIQYLQAKEGIRLETQAQPLEKKPRAKSRRTNPRTSKPHPASKPR